jgi:hypothetical protein
VHLSRTYVRVPAKVAREVFGTPVPSTATNVWLRFGNSSKLSEQVYKMDKQEEFTPGKYRLAAVKPPKPKRQAKTAATPRKPRIKVARRMSQQRSLEGVRKFGINR